MNYKISISIIIPVFNVEKYLEKCLNSIIIQNIDKITIEIIIIDDGSTDSSLYICKKYQKKYSFINIIIQENQGQGIARNTGILASNGKYIVFVDPDDWIEQGYLENLFLIMENSNADFCNFGIDFIDKYGHVKKSFNKFNIKELVGDSIFTFSLIDKYILSSPCNKIYLKSFIINNNIFFPKIRAYEDIFFTRFLASKASRCIFINKVFYHALIRNDSTSRNINGSNIQSALDILNLQESIFITVNTNEIVRKYFYAHYIKFLSSLIISISFRINEFNLYLSFYNKLCNNDYRYLSLKFDILKLLPLKNIFIIVLSFHPRFLRLNVKFLKFFNINPY